MKGIRTVAIAFVIAVLFLSSCASPTAAPTSQPVETQAPTVPPALLPQVPVDGPELVTGEFSYSNDFVVETYFVEHAVALLDLTGFVLRDKEWELPVDSQVLGYVKVDTDKNQGSYRLQLPVKPAGVLNDVDQNGKTDPGVQIFTVGYAPNLSGDPFSVGDDKSLGWPAYLASIKTDAENQDEVTGGKLVVWAPDANQQFPTSFGADHLLFTTDDPVGPLPAGYAFIDLDQEPFGISQKAEEAMTLYEPTDVALKDYSKDTYVDAFKKMFEFVRKEYAFNGIEGKQPDWDALYKDLLPKVEEAEKNKDPKAFYLALRDYTLAFKDGHVGLDGGEIAQEYFASKTSGGYGFAIRELDDKRAVVMFVLQNGPAEAAGIELGAEITAFNGTPIRDAIGKVAPLSAPHSTEFALRYQQARYLLAAEPGATATVTFTNPGQPSKTVTLTAIPERASLQATSLYRGLDPNALPVEFRLLDSGVGYVQITSNYDDLNLIIRLFERALKTFEANQAPGLIIDLRTNGGGSPLDLAGFLTDKEITLGQLEYFSDKTGKFEPEGPIGKVYPKETQYKFNRMALLVDQGCFSACEIESYGFSQVPGMVVVGQYPTGGVEAEVARGQFSLPEEMTLQVPTGRFTLADGSLFLEGKGVEPTVRVPIDETTVFSNEDEVLKRAETIVMVPEGADQKPASSPTFAANSKATNALLYGQAKFLEDLAREQYSGPPNPNGVHAYTVIVEKPEPLLWVGGWCASNQATLTKNLEKISFEFSVNGETVPADKFQKYEGPAGGQSCRLYYALVEEWPAGKHELHTRMSIKAEINDGIQNYQPGDRLFDYTVYVKP